MEVGINGLGLCEHCGLPFTPALLEKYSGGRMECPNCRKKITAKSFGHEGGKKVKWVGPEGKWLDKKPQQNFILPGYRWCVVVNRAPLEEKPRPQERRPPPRPPSPRRANEEPNYWDDEEDEDVPF